MAPTEDSVYFPPLDKCLAGDFQLLSWKTTFSNLSKAAAGPVHQKLRPFLNDHRAFQPLVQALNPFSPPTSQTKATFETHTSAISITPTAHGRYDIGRIKEDSLWLSKETNIDEVSALRIVVLEWQSRPAGQLLDSREDNIRLQDLVTDGGVHSSLVGSKFTVCQDSSLLGRDDTETFNSSKERHVRLLYLYLHERRYLLKTTEFLVSCALNKLPTQEPNASETQHGSGVIGDRWMEEIGAAIIKSWEVTEKSSASRFHWIVDAVAALDLRIYSMRTGCQWPRDQDNAEELGLAWSRNQLLEMIHIMKLILIIVDSNRTLPRSDILLAWYRLMGRCSFFENFELPYELLSIYKVPIQSFVALISLAMLKTSLALEAVEKYFESSTPATESIACGSYLLDTQVMEEVNQVIFDAAQASSCNACLAVFAWGIILQSIRLHAESLRGTRELRQNQRTVDTFETVEVLDTEADENSSNQRPPLIRRRSSGGSDSSQQLTFLEELNSRMDRSALVDTDYVVLLAKSAVDQTHVYDVISSVALNFCSPYEVQHSGTFGLRMKSTLLELVRSSLEEMGYHPELLQATLNILQRPEKNWNISTQTMTFAEYQPSAVFLNDDLLMTNIFEVALSRFPHEMIPFLQLCQALAGSHSNFGEGRFPIISILNNIGSFTCLLDEEFSSYSINANDDPDQIALTTHLDMFLDHPVSDQQQLGQIMTRKVTLRSPSDSFWLSPGTTGRLLTQRKPLVVLWRHHYSCLKYLGRLLQRFAERKRKPIQLYGTENIRDIVPEIISLITALLVPTSSSKANGEVDSRAQDIAHTILEEASDGLERNQDIIAVVFAIFETELHRRPTASGDAESIEILIRCIHFTHALLRVLPGRVWPFIGRSGLLGLDGAECRLNAVVTANELPLGQYGFLIGCLKFFDALVEDALIHAQSRRVSSTVSTRFTNSEPGMVGNGVTNGVMMKILLGSQHAMMEVFEGIQNWRFVCVEEKLEINSSICSLFDKTLLSCFAVDDTTDVSLKLVDFLGPSVNYLLDIFSSKVPNNLAIQPLFYMLFEGLCTPDDSLLGAGVQSWVSQTTNAICLGRTLLRVNQYLENFSTQLEDRFFKITPILVRLYATRDEYRLPVVGLFEALVYRAGSSPSQPPSLIAHLGQSKARQFLDMLSVLGRPLDDEDTRIAIWRLLSAIVSQRQQWLAMHILTGNTPRNAVKDKSLAQNSTFATVRPILNLALDYISNLPSVPPDEAIGVLEFLALAADFWPWVLTEVEKHTRVIGTFKEFLGQMKIVLSNQSSENIIFGAKQIKMSSLIVDILAMCVYHHKQDTNNEFAKQLLPSLNYLIQNGVVTPSYNSSLHGNLRKNLEAKFLGTSLLNFKQTLLQKSALGIDYYYNINFAEKTLSYDPSWKGKSGQGFAEEFMRANVNLSLVEAQMSLFRSWASLMNQLSAPLGTVNSFQKSMATVVGDCLRYNGENTLPQAIFNKLAQSKADVAFVLLQHIIDVNRHSVEAQAILKPAWDTLRSQNLDLGSALIGVGATYSRTLLKILCLALQAHTGGGRKRKLESWQTPDSQRPETIQALQAILEILAVVVAQGFRSLTTLLYEDATQISPVDFGLINAILRTCLRVPGVEKHNEQLVTHFADDNTARYASTLLSWSDKLLHNNEPIYGEISIVFLLELSSVPILAESIAVNGTLSLILAANLMGYFRRPGGIGPFDKPQIMHGIWARGILPLALNLLTAIGAPIAAEVACFLAQFRPQLDRAAANFDVKSAASATDLAAGYITLDMAAETHSLALIATLLDVFREAGASAGIISSDIVPLGWDHAAVKEDLYGWLGRRGALRDCIVATNEKEERWRQMKPMSKDGGAESLLEEKVVAEFNAALRLLEGDGE